MSWSVRKHHSARAAVVRVVVKGLLAVPSTSASTAAAASKPLLHEALFAALPLADLGIRLLCAGQAAGREREREREGGVSCVLAGCFGCWRACCCTVCTCFTPASS